MQYPITYSWDDGANDKGIKFRVAQNSYLQIMCGDPGFDNGVSEYTIVCEDLDRIVNQIHSVREVQILESSSTQATLKFLDPALNLFNLEMKANSSNLLFNAKNDNAQNMTTVLYTQNFSRMRTFYEKTIGLVPTLDNPKRVVYQIPETRATLEVTSCKSQVMVGKAMLQLMERDIDACYDVIIGQDVEFNEHIHSTPYKKRAFSMFDPDHNVIVLYKFI
jgi:hypothetical protein